MPPARLERVNLSLELHGLDLNALEASEFLNENGTGIASNFDQNQAAW